MTNETTPSGTNSGSQTEKLLGLLCPLVERLGYDLVHLEVQMHAPRTLRLFIDRQPSRVDDKPGAPGVSIEDCAIVSRALDEPLEAMPDVEKVFHGPYEL